jgi:hypothetical protein
VTDLLETGSSWLGTVRRAHAGRTVAFRRGVLSAEVTATVGRTVFEVQDADGLLVRTESRDYLIDADLLTAFGEPQAGDEIVDVLAGVSTVFEVMAPGGSPPWDWHDRWNACYRIHTKIIGTE